MMISKTRNVFNLIIFNSYLPRTVFNLNIITNVLLIKPSKRFKSVFKETIKKNISSEQVKGVPVL